MCCWIDWDAGRVATCSEMQGLSGLNNSFCRSPHFHVMHVMWVLTNAFWFWLVKPCQSCWSLMLVWTRVHALCMTGASLDNHSEEAMTAGWENRRWDSLAESLHSVFVIILHYVFLVVSVFLMLSLCEPYLSRSYDVLMLSLCLSYVLLMFFLMFCLPFPYIFLRLSSCFPWAFLPFSLRFSLSFPLVFLLFSLGFP